jgi:hypothetical protein
MLTALRAQKKQQKHDAHINKKFNPEEDLNWSDEDDNWEPELTISTRQQYVSKKDPLDSGDNTSRPSTSRPTTPGGSAAMSGKVTLMQPPIIEAGKLKDYKRSYLSGDANTQTLEERAKKKQLLQSQYRCRLPLPYVPSHVVDNIGLEGLFYLWNLCLTLDSEIDESELIRHKFVEELVQSFAVFINVSYHKLYCQFDVADPEDDYIEFIDLAKQLAANLCAIPPTFQGPDVAFAQCCCATSACRIHPTTIECSKGQVLHKKLTRMTHEEEINQDPYQENALKNFPLFVVYQRYKQRFNGLVRVKHLRSILDDAFIKYDPRELPMEYLILYREFVIKSFPELTWIVCRVCSIYLTVPDTYRISDWLLTVYKMPLLQYFQLKFIEQDADGEGRLVAAKILELFKTLGVTLSIYQVTDWVNTFGEELQEEIESISVRRKEKYFRFSHFMALLFKIEKKVIVLSKNRDVLAMMREAHKHINTFQVALLG